MSLFELEGEGIVLSAIKKAWDQSQDVVVRIYESEGNQSKGALKITGVKKAWFSDMKEEKGEQNISSEIDCLIDVNVEAHIPDRYISNTSQRIDVYRRIADIRSVADSEDVKDELRDRFGEIPQEVVGLIDIALIRNTANALGIYEIRQSDTALLLYVKSLQSEGTDKILSSLGRQASVSAGAKPYISVKFPKGMPILDVMKATCARLQ